MHSGDPLARVNGYSLAAQKRAEIQKTLEALRAMSDALSRVLDAHGNDDARGPVPFEENPLVTALELNPQTR